MNEFLEAINGSEEKDSSKDRYEKVKKEEAGTKDEDLAEKRYQELKEEAKEEFVRKQEKREREEPEEEEIDDSEESDVFITH